MRPFILLAALAAAGCAGTGGDSMTAKERPALVTMKGQPLVLEGNLVRLGDLAPDFRVADAAFKPVRLKHFRGKVCLIAAVPSLDTPVCSIETKRFNDEAAKLPADVTVMTISMDLPFAQKRFCDAEKVARVQVLSDQVWREFGPAYGVVIKDMGILARSVFVVDRDGRLIYRQIVPELSSEPDYAAALDAARKADARKVTPKTGEKPLDSTKHTRVGG